MAAARHVQGAARGGSGTSGRRAAPGTQRCVQSGVRGGGHPPRGAMMIQRQELGRGGGGTSATGPAHVRGGPWRRVQVTACKTRACGSDGRVWSSAWAAAAAATASTCRQRPRHAPAAEAPLPEGGTEPWPAHGGGAAAARRKAWQPYTHSLEAGGRPDPRLLLAGRVERTRERGWRGQQPGSSLSGNGEISANAVSVVN